ncbi:alpha/beta fold hydrolase [Dactylosporangium cerinum]
MDRFISFDGAGIAYQVWGGPSPLPPVVLHHGFVVDATTNFVAPGVVAALVAAGRRVIAPDARGHGASDKPHDPDRYGEAVMARDLAGLLDTLGLDTVDLVGYSMGAVVAAVFASTDDRVRRLVLSGVGAGVVELGGLDTRAMPPQRSPRCCSPRRRRRSRRRRPHRSAGSPMPSVPTGPPWRRRCTRRTGPRSPWTGSPRPRSSSPGRTTPSPPVPRSSPARSPAHGGAW